MQKPLKVREFVVKEDKNPRSFCDSFVYEPSNYEEEKLGILILMGEALNFHPEARYLLNYFASVIRRDYYSVRSDEPPAALESALKRVNFILTEIKRREGADLKEKIRFSAAAIADGRLFLSQMGKIHNLLLRTGQMFDLSKKICQLTDCFPGNFSHTLRGQLYLGDKIVFATENFFRTLTVREFKQIFESETLDEATRDLEVIFNGPRRENLAAVMIESLTGAPAPKPKVTQKNKKPDTLTLEEIFRRPTREPEVKEITLFEEAPVGSEKPDKNFKKEIGIHIPSSAGRITLIAAKITAKLPRFKISGFNSRGLPLGRLFTKSANPLFYFKRKISLKRIYLVTSLIFAGLLAAFVTQNGARREDNFCADSTRLVSEAKKKMEESAGAAIIKDRETAIKNLIDAQTLVKIVLQSHLRERRGPDAAADEAAGLAAEINRQLIKLESQKTKKK